MKKLSVVLLFALVCVGTSLNAQEPQVNQKPNLNINVTGKLSAKADVAIVALSVRSTAPLAVDALDQNNKKIEDIKARLTALGYKDEQVKFSDSRFGPSRGGQYTAGQRNRSV